MARSHESARTPRRCSSPIPAGITRAPGCSCCRRQPPTAHGPPRSSRKTPATAIGGRTGRGSTSTGRGRRASPGWLATCSTCWRRRMAARLSPRIRRSFVATRPRTCWRHCSTRNVGVSCSSPGARPTSRSRNGRTTSAGCSTTRWASRPGTCSTPRPPSFCNTSSGHVTPSRPGLCAPSFPGCTPRRTSTPSATGSSPPRRFSRRTRSRSRGPSVHALRSSLSPPRCRPGRGALAIASRSWRTRSTSTRASRRSPRRTASATRSPSARTRSRRRTDRRPRLVLRQSSSRCLPLRRFSTSSRSSCSGHPWTPSCCGRSPRRVRSPTPAPGRSSRCR